jgi:hypothetical protein
LLKCYSSSSSSSEDASDEDQAQKMKGVESTSQVQKKSTKLFSIKGALDLIDHSPVVPHSLAE